jgi:nucleotide-binding universal stress UspA family protein
MALRNLLVHVDQTNDSPKRVDYAVQLAARENAHLTALYCVGEFLLPGWADVPGQVVAEQRRKETERGEAVLQQFRDTAEKQGISYETRMAEVPADSVADEVAVNARYSDLAILGQVNPDEIPTGGRHIVETVVMGAGRPVLVVPYIGAPKAANGDLRIGRNIMVSWDAGREATRAVNDAMPFLERADKATVVAINPTRSFGRHGDEPGADIGLHIARHDVKVDVTHYNMGDMGPGDAMLSRVSDLDADMLVMGAYGHSRMREIILGGATRTILEHMTVPVLMSH